MDRQHYLNEFKKYFELIDEQPAIVNHARQYAHLRATKPVAKIPTGVEVLNVNWETRVLYVTYICDENKGDQD